MTGTGLQPVEARVILAIDRAWLDEKAKEKPATPAPGAPPPRSGRGSARTRS